MFNFNLNCKKNYLVIKFKNKTPNNQRKLVIIDGYAM